MPTVDMDETTAVACADMIISENKCGITELRWFGGEPLCNDAVIDIICGRIRDSGIKYASSMITNASLFTKEIIDKATELWHLKALQVTLDGTEKVYNRVKNYKDFQCKNPYLAVIKNMNELLDKGIKVAVRLNFDLYNADNLYLLADFLSERFGEYENFFVYPYPLYENCGYKKKNRTADEKIKLIDKYIAFEEYCRSLGILEKHNIKSSYRTQHCMADNNRVTAITAEGKLAKCPHLTDDTYGNVFDKERNIANIFEWQKRITNIPECKKCFNFFDCHKIEKCPHDMVCDAPYRKLNIIRIKNSIIEEYKKSKEMAANL